MIQGWRSLGLAALMFVCLACLPAKDSPGSGQLAMNTWSLVAADVDSGEVGVALASCVPADVSVSSSKVSVPGREEEVRSYSAVAGANGGLSVQLARLTAGVGAVVAQAVVDSGNARRLDRATAELVSGAPADRVLDVVKAGDSRVEQRQYGVVTFTPQAASFTGSGAIEWADAAGTEAVSVQGNLLVGLEVVERALKAFQAVQGSPIGTLGDALIAGLETGAAAGGDKRCPRDQSALFAFMVVVRSDDTEEVPYLWLTAGPQERGGGNPVELLRAAYDDLSASPPGTAAGGGDGGSLTPLWMLTLIAPMLAGFALWRARRRRLRS